MCTYLQTHEVCALNMDSFFYVNHISIKCFFKLGKKNQKNKELMRWIIANSIGRHKSNHIIMTFNENGLNIPIKGQSLTDWTQKQDEVYIVKYKDTDRLNVKG